MKASDFDFVLPEELIAQRPAEGGREQSRLMVLDREGKSIEHKHFYDLPSLLQDGDVLVMNNSKVFPARLVGKKAETGGRVEFLLLHRLATEGSEEEWEAMVGGKKVQEGQLVDFLADFYGRVGERASENTRKVYFDYDAETVGRYLEQHGKTPIPPYINENDFSEERLRNEYQTVYAKEQGSAAAPTAGLHFTEEILRELDALGVQREEITLHVGLGTFAPVKADDVKDHDMHSELATITEEVAERINTARSEGRRIIAVGTTSVRTLESFMEDGELQHGSKWTNIFITPGFEYQCVNALITNFHLPKSTLMMLVSALAGTEFIKTAYDEAVRERYRFYSFGDAMFIQ